VSTYTASLADYQQEADALRQPLRRDDANRTVHAEA
jgi:hypothetical protein